MKNPRASAADAREESSIPGSGGSPGGGGGTHCSLLAWRIPPTEEPGGLQPTGLTKSDTTEHAHSLLSAKELAPSSEYLSSVYFFHAVP